MGNKARRQWNNGCNVLKDKRTTQKYHSYLIVEKSDITKHIMSFSAGRGEEGGTKKNIQQNPVNPVLNEKAVLNSSALLLRYNSHTIQFI